MCRQCNEKEKKVPVDNQVTFIKNREKPSVPPFFSAKLYNDMDNFLFMRLNDGISDFSFSKKDSAEFQKRMKTTNCALIFQCLQQNFSSNSSKK